MGGPGRVNLFAPLGGAQNPPPHTVAEGETLQSIAQQYGVTLRALVQTNNGLLNDPAQRTRGGYREVRAGDQLTIPPRQQVSSRTQTQQPGDSGPTDQVVQSTTPQLPADGSQATNPQQALNPNNTPRAAEGQKKEGGGILGFLKQLFANPIFQGILAVLSAIPGIGQVVSAVGFVVGLTQFIAGMLQKPPDFNWLALGSTLLFGVGILMPGVGAFGGLLGMGAALDGKAKPKAPTQPEAAHDHAGNSPANNATPLSAEEYTAHMQAARQFDTSTEGFTGWQRHVELLHDEYQRLVQAGQQERDAARLAELDRFFKAELPERVLGFARQVAYGTQTTSPTAAARSLYQVPAGTSLDALSAGVASTAKMPADKVAAAIRAYNGLDANAQIDGQVLYIPDAPQIQAFGERQTIYINDASKRPPREALRRLVPGAGQGGVLSHSAAGTEAARMIEVLLNMAVRPTVISQTRSGGQAQAAVG